MVGSNSVLGITWAIGNWSLGITFSAWSGNHVVLGILADHARRLGIRFSPVVGITWSDWESRGKV